MISIKTYYKLPICYKTQIDSLNRAAFPINKSNIETESEEFYRRNQDRLARVLFINDNDTVLGKISIFKRKVSINKKAITIGGIGGVCTNPNYLRQGIASQLIQQAIKTLAENSCDVVFLSTDISLSWKTKMYQKFGFKLLNNGYSFIRKSGNKVVRKDGFILVLKPNHFLHILLSSSIPFYIGKGRW